MMSRLSPLIKRQLLVRDEFSFHLGYTQMICGFLNLFPTYYTFDVQFYYKFTILKNRALSKLNNILVAQAVHL